MFSKYLAAAAAALAMAASAPAAQAQELAPAEREDLQCFLIFTAMVGQDGGSNPQMLAGLVGGMAYFFGRLEAGSPGRDWLAYIASNQSMAESLLQDQPAFQRCGQEMTTIGARMTSFGQQMTAGQ